MSNSIKVVARFRPQNATELQLGGSQIFRMFGNDTCRIETKDIDASFTFDRVFSTTSTQSEVFDFSIRSTVDDILKGYNGTVLAYGQTGSGKSYTMMGPNITGAERGIIPRIVDQIFASIMQSPPEIEYTVRVSYMEIYMERIKDLLQPALDNLPIHEEKSKGVYVKGLSEIYVSSVEEVYDVMAKGGSARAVGSTMMNQESSRSHTIFAVVVSQKNIETGSSKSGQLFLVDLAGSEKVGKTGASGLVLEEAKKINKSLSALGMVINALTDGKSSHIPYRDSKLTRILQESLGGNSRTTLIVNCSPSSYNDQETISTLRFGTRAKNIKNRPKINTELSASELKQQLTNALSQKASLVQYISSLERELSQWRNGEDIPKDKWAFKGASLQSYQTSDQFGPIPYQYSRSGSPGSSLDLDDRDEFLARENDMQDRLTDRETVISGLERLVLEAKEENEALRLKDKKSERLIESLHTEISNLKQETEKLQLDAQENTTLIDSLKEFNAETISDIDSLREQLHEASSRAKEQNSRLEERKRRKREKLQQMVTGFEFFTVSESILEDDDDSTLVDGAQARSESDKDNKEDWIGSAISILDLHDRADALEPSYVAALKVYLMEARAFIARTEQFLVNRLDEVEMQMERREEIETLVRDMENQVAIMANSSSDDRKYEAFVTGKQMLLENLLSESKKNLNLVLSDNKRLRKMMTAEMGSNSSDSVRPSSASSSVISSASSVSGCTKQRDTQANSLAAPNLPEAKGVSMSQSPPTALSTSARTLPLKDATGHTAEHLISDYEAANKSLMRDLQDRCERVVELEIALEDLREQFKAVLNSTSVSRVQHKRMAILERNLDQLTKIQRTLVDQNTQLKRDLALMERKLVSRNERIASLEALYQDSQERLGAEPEVYETRLGALRERLDDVKVFRKQAETNRPIDTGPSLKGVQRIVKPLRGGGVGLLALSGGNTSPQSAYTTNSENRSNSSNSSPTQNQKRNSWFSRS